MLMASPSCYFIISEGKIQVVVGDSKGVVMTDPMEIHQSPSQNAIRETKFLWDTEKVLIVISDCLKGEK